jgi:hypothetical protein
VTFLVSDMPTVLEAGWAIWSERKGQAVEKRDVRREKETSIRNDTKVIRSAEL